MCGACSELYNRNTESDKEQTLMVKQALTQKLSMNQLERHLETPGVERFFPYMVTLERGSYQWKAYSKSRNEDTFSTSIEHFYPEKSGIQMHMECFCV